MSQASFHPEKAAHNSALIVEQLASFSENPPNQYVYVWFRILTI